MSKQTAVELLKKINKTYKYAFPKELHEAEAKGTLSAYNYTITQWLKGKNL